MGTDQVVSNSIVIGDVIQVRAGGDVMIDAARPAYGVAVFPSPKPLRRATAARQPSLLLHARHAIVPFSGRTEMLSDLRNWRGDGYPRSPDAEPLAIRLLHGGGGLGKTRLAAEFAARTMAAGWQVWRVEHGAAPGTTVMPLPGSGSGLLAIVDYADRWPAPDLESLVRHLGSIAESAGVPVRALFLARSAGFWWSAAATVFDAEADEVRLESPSGTGVRHQQFADARDAFAAALGCDPSDVLGPPPLTGDAYAHVLAVHMAALVAVDAARSGADLPASPQAMSQYLLHRERAYWRDLHVHGADRLSTDPRTMGRTVFTATLTGALPHSVALSALSRMPVDAAARQRIIDDHAVCYPPGQDHLVLEPLHPDRLGEDFLALTMPGSGQHGDWADAWSAGVPEHLAVAGVRGGVTLLESWTPHTMTVLIETGRRWPHVARGHLFPLVRQHPGLVVAAGSAAMARLAGVPDPDLGALTAVSDLIGDSRVRGFEAGIAALTETLTQHALAEATTDEERGDLHLRLADRLEPTGRAEAALREYTAAATILRALTTRDPEPFRSRLAESLLGVCTAQASLNRAREALTAAEEAAVLARAAADGDEGLALLAKCLSVLGARREDLGDLDGALSAVEEAVTICRELNLREQRFGWHLSVHLTGLSGRLIDVGRIDDGIAVASEAIELIRERADRHPEADVDAELAIALNNLGTGLRASGSWEDADRTNEHLIEVRRRLAATDPVNFEAELGISLTNAAAVRLDLGRVESAWRTTREAVDILRRLTSADPLRHAPALAQVLVAHSATAVRADRHDEALAAATEALQGYRGLPAHMERRHRAATGIAAMNLASVLNVLGRAEEAFAVNSQALGTFRALPPPEDRAHRANLALALVNQGKHLADIDRTAEALSLTDEAIAIYRSLEGSDAALAFALTNQALNLAALHRPAEGLEAGMEAVGILHRLAQDNADAHQPELARAMSGTALVAVMLGRFDEARRVQATVMKIWRNLADRHPGVYESNLADATEQAAAFVQLAAAVRPPSAGRPELAVAAAVEERFGAAGLGEIYDSLVPEDCQTCGLALRGSPMALQIHDFGPAVVAALHHARCRGPELNRADSNGILTITDTGAGMTWRSQGATVAFGSGSGHVQHIAAVVLNPGLEQVWAYQAEGGAWRVRPHDAFIQAGLVPMTGFTLGRPVTGVQARLHRDDIEIKVAGWPSAFLTPYVNPAFERHAHGFRRTFLLVVTHAADPATMTGPDDLRRILVDHRTVLGRVRITP